MKTLCLGGSFNPIHHGHLICARAAAEAKGFARVALVPSAQPPHKPRQADLADASHRLAMCRLACQPAQVALGTDVVFDVLDLELTRPGLSYTIDTVRELRRRGWDQVHWLIGADMLNYLPKWHQPAALLREANFLIMARPEVPIDWKLLGPEFATLRNNLVSTPLIEISSTDIRRRVRAGLAIDYLTTPAVIEYIVANDLYRRETA